LSKQKWLLKRSDKLNVLKEFCAKSGEVFVSGDYEAATDSFNSEHSRRILSNIFAGSSCIPLNIQLAALDSLTGFVEWDGTVYVQRTGQLMGNFLSFPLLCLTNYITLVHALGWDRVQSIPVKINGDDIVFRCTRAEYRLWSSMVSESGLVLSRGKTLVHSRFFTINSAAFKAKNKRPSVVAVLRPATMLKKIENPAQLSGIAKSATWGWYGKQRRAIYSWLAKYHYHVVQKGPSLLRGYGWKVTPDEFLKDRGLLTHEVAWLELPATVDVIREERTEPVSFSTFKKLRKRDFCKGCQGDATVQLTIANNVRAFKSEKINRKKESVSLEYTGTAKSLRMRMLGKVQSQRSRGAYVVDITPLREDTGVLYVQTEPHEVTTDNPLLDDWVVIDTYASAWTCLEPSQREFKIHLYDIEEKGKSKKEWMREKTRQIIDLVWGRKVLSKIPRKVEEHMWADPQDFPTCSSLCTFRYNARQCGYARKEFVVSLST
jgi:hypothetical protein